MKGVGIPVPIASFETGHGISSEMIETTFRPSPPRSANKKADFFEIRSVWCYADTHADPI
jgi:hypothetical protein